MKKTITAKDFNHERSTWLRRVMDGDVAELIVTYHGKPAIRILSVKKSAPGVSPGRTG